MTRQNDTTTTTTRLDGIRASAERRAAVAREAQAAVHATHGRAWPGGDAAADKAWHEAIALTHEVRSSGYPRDFWDAFDDLKLRSPGDGRTAAAAPRSIEIAILFLEEDAMFFRSGYVKASTIRRLLRQPLDAEQVERLGEVVLSVVDRRASQEFRRYCRLAVRVMTPALLAALGKRLEDRDPDVRRRSGWMLDAIGNSRNNRAISPA